MLILIIMMIIMIIMIIMFSMPLTNSKLPGSGTVFPG